MAVEKGALLSGRYRLQQSIGRGGMADVHLAFDNKRQAAVAVKILREDLAEEPDFVRRFRREAEALARLDHPNIVHFYAFEQDGSSAFIVMDYIDGSTLRGLLHERHKPLDVKKITPILRDVCSALHYAHLNGFVHRDLKPGNVMLKQDGKALLTDFGISHATTGFTLTGAVMGTPAYMSPEQVTGSPVNARSDIYSLGALLFEMATGRRPFTGDEPGLTETSTALRIQEAHLRLTPPDPRTFNPRLPSAAAAVILRALAKEPGRRWPDVVSLRQAWEAAVGAANAPAADAQARRSPAGKASTAPRPAGGRGLPRWGPVLVGVAIVAVAAVLVITSRTPVGKPPAAQGTTTTRATATAQASAIAMSSAVSPPALQAPPPTATRRQSTGGGVQVATRAPAAAASAIQAARTTAAVTNASAIAGAASLATTQTGSNEPTVIPTRTVAPTKKPVTPTSQPTAKRAAPVPTIVAGPSRTPIVPPAAQPAAAADPIERWLSKNSSDKITAVSVNTMPGSTTFSWRWTGEALLTDTHFETVICKPDKPFPDAGGYDCLSSSVSCDASGSCESQTGGSACNKRPSGNFNPTAVPRSFFSFIYCGESSSLNWGIVAAADKPYRRLFVYGPMQFSYQARN